MVRRNIRNLTSLHPSLSHLLLSPDLPDTRHEHTIVTVAPPLRFLILVSAVLCCFVHRDSSVLLYIYLAPPVSAGVALTVVKRALQSILMSVSLGTALLPDG